MTKAIISVIVILSSLMVFGQSSPYSMIKTPKTKVTASNLNHPYYVENIHPKEKLLKKGKHASKREEYHANGSLKEVYYQYRINGNMFTYCIRRYYANGQLKYDHYQNPFNAQKVEGYENEFYENGQLKETSWKIAFYYVGNRYCFYENGQLESYGYYAGFEGRDMEQDLWKYYFDNGQLKAVGAYKNYFFAQKTRNERIKAPSSTKIGEWKYYNEYGELTKTENF